MSLALNQSPKIIEFLAREDGTALNSVTGLTWCRYLVGQVWQKRIAVGDPLELPLTEAMKAIDELNAQKFGSFSDWRLPSQAELEAVTGENKKLVSNNRGFMGENEAVFSPASQNVNQFWTTAALSAQNSSVEAIVGYYGGKAARTQFTSKYARLVRG